jgi:predicted nucleic acid-binding protein
VIVVDTNVVSELMRPSPAHQIREWASAQTRGELSTTAVTVAEIRYGLERMPAGRRKDSLLAAAAEVFTAFSDHIQPFDADAANWYATIVASRDRLGLPIDGFNAQIAAICRARGATLATRNTRDFTETGIVVIDPWRHGSHAGNGS